MAQSERPIVLYKQAEAWQLPSVSPACLQAEAYLRFTGVPFAVQVCSSSSASPTGQTPALEKDAQVAGLDADDAPGPSSSAAASGVLGEYRAARACIAFARQHIKDLDAGLSAVQRAELLAYSVLVQSRLEAAALVAAWCEPVGYEETRKVMGKGQPFPLNYIIPFNQQREVRRKFGHLKAAEVYADAAAALSALAERLHRSGGRYFFGTQPCSLDALLFALLAHFRRSPAVAPVLQNKVSNSTVLCEYVDCVMREYFGSAAPLAGPPPKEASDWAWAASWSDAAKGQKPPEAKAEPTPAEKQFRRNSWLWLMGVGVAVAGYLLLSGKYIKVVDMRQMMAADDDDEDGDEEEDEGDES